MQRVTVVSSNIDSVGYDSSNNILEVEFLNGGLYHYFNVPSNIHSSLMSANSHGTFLNDNVKGNYTYKKIN